VNGITITTDYIIEGAHADPAHQSAVKSAFELAFNVPDSPQVRCTQPATVPFNTLGYLFSAVVKHPVTVAG
jgi:hypothetical protein